MTRAYREVARYPRADEQRPSVMGGRITLAQRSGFTLVELLVVIVIIGILAALIVPAVSQARLTARNAVTKTDIDLLTMAIENYRNEYGSYPPCSSGTAANDPAARHIRRLFPRTAASYAPSAATTPANSLVGWLGGYTKNPTDPLDLLGAKIPRVKLFDFDQTRVTSNQYHPADKPGSPYIYIDKAYYGTPVTVGANTYTANVTDNPDTFQILCAGLDEEWGTDDDLSNFWKGTRGDQ